MPSAAARVISGSRARPASSGYRRLMYSTHWRCFQVRCGSAAATSAGTLWCNSVSAAARAEICAGLDDASPQYRSGQAAHDEGRGRGARVEVEGGG